MPLPAVAESLDKIPEAFRGEYESKDGKFHLKIEGEPAGFVTAAKFAEFRENNKMLFEEKKQLAAAIEKFKDIDPDKARDALSKIKQIDDQQLIDQGKLPELIDQRVAEYKTQSEAEKTELRTALTAEQTRREQAEIELFQRIVRDDVQRIAIKMKVKPASFAFLTQLAIGGGHNGIRWMMNAEKQVVAKKADGQPAFSAKVPGKPLDLEEYAESVIKEYPEIRLASSGGSAPGSMVSGNSHGVDYASMNPTERMKAVRANRQAA